MNQTKERTVNYGLALLKAFMCFIVVLCHFWSTEIPIYLMPFAVLTPYAVPVFMFISFYLTQKSFLRKDKEFAVKRLWKLILPQLLWAVIYFVVYWVTDMLVHGSPARSLKDLLWQILTGHSQQLNPTMWFQVDLIAITALFFVIFYYCNEKVGLALIAVLSAGCLFLQYSGINYKLFGGLRYELSYPLGRLIETIPAAAMGIIASRYNLLTPRKTNRIMTLLITFVLFGLFLVLDKKIPISAKSFSYAGIWKLACAFVLTMFAYNLNFDVMGQKGKQALSFVTKYTLGIYCGHRLVAFFVFYGLSKFLGVETGRFYQCIIIYIVGFIACWAISKIPFKWIKSIV